MCQVVQTVCCFTFWIFLGQVNSVAFNEESTVAVSGCQDGVVRCFDLRDRNAPIQVIFCSHLAYCHSFFQPSMQICE